jgi:hypothetical protein
MLDAAALSRISISDASVQAWLVDPAAWTLRAGRSGRPAQPVHLVPRRDVNVV